MKMTRDLQNETCDNCARFPLNNCIAWKNEGTINWCPSWEPMLTPPKGESL